MNGVPQPKDYFAAVPARAVGDARLSGLHYRLLCAIAVHDRMSIRTQGQGCWASLKTLAAKCGCNYSNASVAGNELVDYGYIITEKHPQDERRRIWRVLYTDEDEAYAGSLPTGKASPNVVCPEAKHADEDVRPQANRPDEIVCPAIPEVVEGTEVSSHNIFRRNGTEHIPQKRSQRYSAETGARRSDGSILAIIKRRLSTAETIDRDEYVTIETELGRILESSEGGSVNYGWAEQLLGRLETFSRSF